MTITMNDDNLTSAVQLFDIVKAGMAIRFAAEDRAKTYAWIETALGKFRISKNQSSDSTTGRKIYSKL